MKKVTMQEIAEALNISRVTVWKVFSNRGGVSEDLKAKIIKKAEDMHYLVPENIRTSSEGDEIEKEETITVSVAVSRPESSLFWMKIIHRMAKELLTYNVNLLYTYLPTSVPANYVLPAMLTNQSVQGIIVLNVYDSKLIHLLNEVNIPKVFMDVDTGMPLETLNGDLVLLEGLYSISQITDYIIKKGRTQIGFIGDINYALTNYRRYEGYLQAMKQNNLTVNPKFCLTNNIGIDSYQEEIEDFLDHLDKMPEAFICASDYIGHIVIQYCEKHNYRIPQDIAISGYDNNQEYADAENLTTVQVQNDTIGKRLVVQMMYRMENPEAAYEIVNIHSKVEYRKSTDF
jgi:LacI family transcriptional regulator